MENKTHRGFTSPIIIIDECCFMHMIFYPKMKKNRIKNKSKKWTNPKVVVRPLKTNLQFRPMSRLSRTKKRNIYVNK